MGSKRSTAAITKRANILHIKSNYNAPRTEEEIQDLQQGKLIMNRTSKQCTNMCRQYEIIHPIYRPPHFWTLEEEEILRQYYPTEGAQVSERLPGRAAHSVATHAHKMKLCSQRDVIKFMTAATSKAVRCLETGEIFDSIVQANKKYPGAENLKKVIEGTRAYAGTLPDGTKLHWQYVEESSEKK